MFTSGKTGNYIMFINQRMDKNPQTSSVALIPGLGLMPRLGAPPAVRSLTHPGPHGPREVEKLGHCKGPWASGIGIRTRGRQGEEY